MGVSDNVVLKDKRELGKDIKTSKIQKAIKEDRIEIIHVNWLYQTFFNFGIADCNKFRMFINGDEKYTPPMVYLYLYLYL